MTNINEQKQALIANAKSKGMALTDKGAEKIIFTVAENSGECGKCAVAGLAFDPAHHDDEGGCNVLHMGDLTMEWADAGQSEPEVIVPTVYVMTARDHRKAAAAALKGRPGMTDAQKKAALQSAKAHIMHALSLMEG